MWLLIFSGKQWEQFRVETLDVKDPVERVDLFSDILIFCQYQDHDVFWYFQKV